MGAVGRGQGLSGSTGGLAPPVFVGVGGVGGFGLCEVVLDGVLLGVDGVLDGVFDGVLDGGLDGVFDAGLDGGVFDGDFCGV